MNTDLEYDIEKMTGLKINIEEIADYKPLYHSSDIKARFSDEDTLESCFSSKQALKNAESKKGSYFYTTKTF